MVAVMSTSTDKGGLAATLVELTTELPASGRKSKVVDDVACTATSSSSSSSALHGDIVIIARHGDGDDVALHGDVVDCPRLKDKMDGRPWRLVQSQQAWALGRFLPVQSSGTDPDHDDFVVVVGARRS